LFKTNYNPNRLKAVKNKINFALIGCGYWGPNFIRVIQNSESAFLSQVCDTDENKMAGLKAKHPGLEFTGNLEDIIANPEIEAVVVCTPANTHFDISKKLLLSGKHVLCEKPLANNATQCLELDTISRQTGKKLLVGHVFEYNEVIRHMKKLITCGEIGDIFYMQFTRMGLGPARNDVNVIFDLASHDVSIAVSLMNAMPVAVSANGSCFTKDGLEDVAFVQLEFANKVFANINVSWIDPIKQRIVKVVGSKKMLLFDDISIAEKLKIIKMGKGYQISSGDFGSFQLSVKDGEIMIPNLQHPEPLITEFNHFIAGINGEENIVTDATYAANVVHVLELAQTSIRNNGKKIIL